MVWQWNKDGVLAYWKTAESWEIDHTYTDDLFFNKNVIKKKKVVSINDVGLFVYLFAQNKTKWNKRTLDSYVILYIKINS